MWETDFQAAFLASVREEEDTVAVVASEVEVALRVYAHAEEDIVVDVAIGLEVAVLVCFHSTGHQSQNVLEAAENGNHGMETENRLAYRHIHGEAGELNVDVLGLDQDENHGTEKASQSAYCRNHGEDLSATAVTAESVADAPGYLLATAESAADAPVDFEEEIELHEDVAILLG